MKCMPAKLAALLSTVLSLLIVMNISVLAVAPGDKVDKDAEGSVSISFADADDNPITGGNVELFFIASIEPDEYGNDCYVLLPDYESCPVDYEDFGTAEYAAELYEVIQAKGIAGEIKQVDQNGIAYYDHLQVGMYLVTQPVANTGWYAIKPYIVTIPLEVEDNWVYDLESIPKMSPYCEPVITPQPAPVDPDKKLPQTGMLNWPVPVLALCGMTLVLAGVIVGKREDRDEG